MSKEIWKEFWGDGYSICHTTPKKANCFVGQNSGDLENRIRRELYAAMGRGEGAAILYDYMMFCLTS